jgi:hypothetical protein
MKRGGGEGVQRRTKARKMPSIRTKERKRKENMENKSGKV